jgi:hypothetical protein
VLIIILFQLQSADLRQTWLQAEPEIDVLLLDFLEEQGLHLAHWKKQTDTAREKTLEELRIASQAALGVWKVGWASTLRGIAGKCLIFPPFCHQGVATEHPA